MFDEVSLYPQTLRQITDRLSVLPQLHAGSRIICIPAAGMKLAQGLTAWINSYSLPWLRLSPDAHFTTTSVGITAEKGNGSA